MGKYGFSFSLKRALGITAAKKNLLDKQEYLPQLVELKEK